MKKVFLFMGTVSTIESVDGAEASIKELTEKQVRFGGLQVDKAIAQAGVALFIFLFVSATFYLKMSPPDFALIDPHIPQPAAIEVKDHTELLAKLKELNLWDLHEETEVPKVVFTSFPHDIDALGAAIKKKVFFHTMLPVAMTAIAEVEEERDNLLNILNKFGNKIDNLKFTVDYASWGRRLTLQEINFVLELSRKYRTPHASKLLNRVNTVPVSLVLAQGAIESSWGTSRFAKMGNNLFGVWTWGEKGIVPNGRDTGKLHKIASYDTILDSVRAYIVNLNRLPAYRNFRKIRQFSMDSTELAEGLLYYSEKREEYVWEIQKIIRQNNLKHYDSLTPVDQTTNSRKYIQLTSLTTG